MVIISKEKQKSVKKLIKSAVNDIIKSLGADKEDVEYEIIESEEDFISVNIIYKGREFNLTIEEIKD